MAGKYYANAQIHNEGENVIIKSLTALPETRSQVTPLLYIARKKLRLLIIKAAFQMIPIKKIK